LDIRGVKSLVAIIRPVNCAIIILTVLFAFSYMHVFSLIGFITLSVIYCAIAASGYIINDIYDKDIDAVNAPQRPIPSGALSEKLAWFAYYCWIAVLSIALFFIPTTGAFFAAGCYFITVYYAIAGKKNGLAGNIAVAFLTASPIIAVAIIHSLKLIDFVLPAGCAFLITFMRELSKDCEDIEGDKQFGSKSMPIRYGTRAVFYSILGLTLSLFCFTLNLHGVQTDMWVYFSIVVVMITLGMVIALRAVYIGDYHRASWLYKLLMLLGIGGLWLSR